MKPEELKELQLMGQGTQSPSHPWEQLLVGVEANPEVVKHLALFRAPLEMGMTKRLRWGKIFKDVRWHKDISGVKIYLRFWMTECAKQAVGKCAPPF